jgi:N-acetylneuraminate lyase
MNTDFKGLIAAPYTPTGAGHAINLNIVPPYAELLVRNQVNTAFICGTTGEFASLSVDEREQLATAWLQATARPLRVIVHVGHTALSCAQRLARHANEQGAAAIACMAPWFFKPQSVTEVVTWCSAVASAAPTLPFFYYHMPSMNGVSIPVAAFIEEATRRIPSFAGVKYSHDDLDDLVECVKVSKGRAAVFMGRDELLLEGLRCGVSGAVGSTYNYAAPLYQRLMQAFASGDESLAASLQETAREMISLCSRSKAGHLSRSKTLMKSLGVDCGAVRPPLMQPEKEEIASLHADLNEAGFFEYACRPLSYSA